MREHSDERMQTDCVEAYPRNDDELPRLQQPASKLSSLGHQTHADSTADAGTRQLICVTAMKITSAEFLKSASKKPTGPAMRNLKSLFWAVRMSASRV